MMASARAISEEDITEANFPWLGDIPDTSPELESIEGMPEKNEERVAWLAGQTTVHFNCILAFTLQEMLTSGNLLSVINNIKEHPFNLNGIKYGKGSMQHCHAQMQLTKNDALLREIERHFDTDRLMYIFTELRSSMKKIPLVKIQNLDEFLLFRGIFPYLVVPPK